LGERGLAENVVWGKGLAKNVRIPSYEGRGLKLLKNCHMIFECSLFKNDSYCLGAATQDGKSIEVYKTASDINSKNKIFF